VFCLPNVIETFNFYFKTRLYCVVELVIDCTIVSIFNIFSAVVINNLLFMSSFSDISMNYNLLSFALIFIDLILFLCVTKSHSICYSLTVLLVRCRLVTERRHV